VISAGAKKRKKKKKTGKEFNRKTTEQGEHGGFSELTHPWGRAGYLPRKELGVDEALSG
jgi:hypothetical protein